MNHSIATKISGLPRTFKTSVVAFFILTFLSITTGWAQNYTQFRSNKDGDWEDRINNVWVNNVYPGVNINNGNEVYISHHIETNKVKINNNGTIFILNSGKLTGDVLEMNGKGSSIIISPGGLVEIGEYHFDNTLGTDNLVVKASDLILIPLPVTLVHFGVKNNGQSAASTTLEWKTASEKDNAYFAVEKSLDGKAFAEAGRVTGTNAANGASYTFEDKNVVSRAYYRLKQVDLDGTFTYSAIVVATTNLKPAVYGRKVMFGQTFNGKLNLIGITGRQEASFNLKDSQAFELPENYQGIYILQLEGENQVSTQRICL